MSVPRDAVLQQHLSATPERGRGEGRLLRSVAAVVRLYISAMKALIQLVRSDGVIRVVAALMVNLTAIAWLLLVPYERSLWWAYEHLVKGHWSLFYLGTLLTAHIALLAVMGSALAIGGIVNLGTGGSSLPEVFP